MDDHCATSGGPHAVDDGLPDPGISLGLGRRLGLRVLPARRGLSALPPLALASAAAIWGVTFTVADEAVAVLPPADLVAWRFGLGAVVLTLFTRHLAPLSRALVRHGVVLGGLLGAGFLLQTWGLTYTDALSSGFLTSLLVVIAPLAGWLMFGQRLDLATWTGVALATCGVLALSLREARLGPGELITLASAALWGVHVVLLSRWSLPGHTLQLARCQTVTVAMMAMATVVVSAAFTGRSPLPVLPPDGRTWLSVLFLAVLATAVAMALLSWSQSRVGAARAAVILTLEPVVAGLTAALTGSELTGRVVLGAVLLIGAIYLVELGGRTRPARRA
jgi:drug/metabolite transporter (DMT)-like permease